MKAISSQLILHHLINCIRRSGVHYHGHPLVTKQGVEDVNHLECFYYYSFFRVLTRQRRQEAPIPSRSDWRRSSGGNQMLDEAQRMQAGMRPSPSCYHILNGAFISCQQYSAQLKRTFLQRASYQQGNAVIFLFTNSIIACSRSMLFLLVHEFHDFFLRHAVRADVDDRPPPVMPHPVVPNAGTSLPADRARSDVLL